MVNNMATNIRFFREQMNWTQQQLANKLNVSRSVITKWENESAVPDLDTLIKISDLFSLSLDQLVGRNLTDEFLLKEFKKVYSLDLEDHGDQLIIAIIDLLKKNPSLLNDFVSLSQLPIRKQRAILQIIQTTIQELKRV
ncbi:helix-turn-helix transcriptional regulator [Tenuibacillus multivorans]|uniref:Helix-turn-helix n=1 Tax=Tenuibacillus multivorans TaxID=237069 RepID=A0A1H0FZ12_9BACI|nr:helix-turn-helix transcriptional regulator [Tenuibacillus multivorans]GEL78153.1 hypothetical protein TMU01_23880 [Tenuibacillus multivorans]SDN99794.1 Helix-turn-helix [Tenuibacillus multivorans]